MPMRLHHIGHAVGDISVSARTYAERFGYRIVTPAIHDPLQTALVQFLQLPPDRVLLELVAPDSAGSRLSAVVGRGGGLHHLAYTVGSLLAGVDWLSACGLRLIGDPRPAVAFAGRSICWLMAPDRSLVELIERRSEDDLCIPGPG